MNTSDSQNPLDDLFIRLLSGERKVFTTGMIAQICTLSMHTVSKYFDEGHFPGGYLIPDSQDRRIPRQGLLQFLQTNFQPDGLLWLQKWEEQRKCQRKMRTRHPALIFTADASKPFNPGLLEQARAILSRHDLKGQPQDGAMQCGLAFYDSPRCKAIAIMLCPGAKLPAGFPVPAELEATDRYSTMDCLVLYRAMDKTPLQTADDPPPATTKVGFGGNTGGKNRLAKTAIPPPKQRLRAVLSGSVQVFNLEGVPLS